MTLKFKGAVWATDINLRIIRWYFKLWNWMITKEVKIDRRDPRTELWVMPTFRVLLLPLLVQYTRVIPKSCSHSPLIQHRGFSCSGQRTIYFSFYLTFLPATGLGWSMCLLFLSHIIFGLHMNHLSSIALTTMCIYCIHMPSCSLSSHFTLLRLSWAHRSVCS